MAGSNRADGSEALPLQIIDEQGRVVDTVYVGEITGMFRKEEPPPRERPSAGRGQTS